MANWRDSVEARAKQYAQRYGRTIQDELGFGYDGIVFSTNCQSAIKALRFEPLYARERDVYFRLADEKVSRVLGCKIPKLWHWGDELLVIEMEIVSPPFVLDFAGAYLDQAPDFPEEVMAEWRAEKKEQDWFIAGLPLGAITIFSIVRWTNARHDQKNAIRPPDPP